MVKNKNLEDVTVEQLQAEARCIVHHPVFEEIGKADSVYILILLQNITAKRFPGFRFLCYCLLLFVTVISVARVCRGLDRFLFFYQSTAF